MMLVIHTQYQENYGAHDWDGKGVCPQHWKFKDGTEYKITGVPQGVDLDEVVELMRGDIEESSNYCRVDIVGRFLEKDDYLSWYERSQLDFDGKIQDPSPCIEYSELVEFSQ